MDTKNSTDSSDQDFRPADQQARAQQAHLNPNDPAKDAEAGTPIYSDFGKPSEPAAADSKAPADRSGSNDNPDEFSERHDDKDAQGHPDKLEDQPGHVVQNQDSENVRIAETSGAENDELRAAWSKDDPRYAGGGSHNAFTGTTPDTTARNASEANKTADNQA